MSTERLPNEPSASPQSMTAGSESRAPLPELLAVLECLTTAAGLGFDVSRASRALRQAETDVPPTESRAARRRLIQVAEAMGLHVLTRHLSIREAIAAVEPRTPLAIYAVTPEGHARWHVMVDSRSGKARMAILSSDDSPEWLTADEIARHVGAADADTVVEWLFVQQATPLADASRFAEVSGADREENHGPPPLRRLLGLLRPESRDIVAVIVYSIGVGVLSLAVPITAMAVVNTTALATLVQQLVVLCLALLVSLGLASLLRVLQTIVVEYLQQRFSFASSPTWLIDCPVSS